MTLDDDDDDDDGGGRGVHHPRSIPFCYRIPDFHAARLIHLPIFISCRSRGACSTGGALMNKTVRRERERETEIRPSRPVSRTTGRTDMEAEWFILRESFLFLFDRD